MERPAAALDARIAGGVWCTLPAARTQGGEGGIIRQSKRGRYTAEALTHTNRPSHTEQKQFWEPF